MVYDFGEGMAGMLGEGRPPSTVAGQRKKGDGLHFLAPEYLMRLR